MVMLLLFLYRMIGAWMDLSICRWLAYTLSGFNIQYSMFNAIRHAERHRKKETGLIELLSRPMSFWFNEQHCNTSASMTHHPRRKDRTPPPKSSSPAIDRQELDNVKLLCAQVLKGHKTLAKQMAACQKQVLEAASMKPNSSNNNKADILKELHEQQQHHFYRQLIALGMKEKAFRAHVHRMEERCVKHCDSKVKAWKQGMESWKSSTEQNMQEWQILLEHEVKMNAHFRNGLSEWMEEQQGATETPFMFATNLGELNEEAPLQPKEPLGHVKKRPWKPLFKHWDRIMLDDENQG
jgi:hypothetical protein